MLINEIIILGCVWQIQVIYTFNKFYIITTHKLSEYRTKRFSEHNHYYKVPNIIKTETVTFLIQKISAPAPYTGTNKTSAPNADKDV